jgi:hypothetical protein
MPAQTVSKRTGSAGSQSAKDAGSKSEKDAEQSSHDPNYERKLIDRINNS